MRKILSAKGTKGFEEPIDAKFDVLEGQIDVPADQLPSSVASIKVPLDLLEARNAVVIAKAAGAQQYAPDSLTKAEDMLQRAEDYYQRKQGRTTIGTAARGMGKADPVADNSTATGRQLNRRVEMIE